MPAANYARGERRPRGEKILEFEIEWRRCFVDSLRPSHLPEGWTVDHTIVPRARPPPSTLVCRAHLKGRCTWGSACKYRHLTVCKCLCGRGTSTGPEAKRSPGAESRRVQNSSILRITVA